MATQEEKIAAAEKALSDLGTTDPAEAERFVALFDSQAALLPEREPPVAPAKGEELFVAEQIGPTQNPDKQARIDAVRADLVEIRAMPDEAPVEEV